jgi:type VI secretion system secreted protein VgrG
VKHSFNSATHYGITRAYGGVGRTPGWLVFLSRRGQTARKMFYDAGYDGEVGSLEAAQRYRDEWLATHPPLDAVEFSQQIAAHNTSGIPGVTRSVDPRNGNARWEAFVSFENKKITRAFSINKYGEQVAKDKAISARLALLDQYQSGEVRLYSPVARALERAQQRKDSLSSTSDSESLPKSTARQDTALPSNLKSVSFETNTGASNTKNVFFEAKGKVAITSAEIYASGPSIGSSMTRSITAITPLGDELLFSAMSGREEMSRLFEFQVELLSESHTISPPALLGKSISLDIMTHKGGKRYLDGHCMRFAYLGNHGRFFKYQATLRPTLWYATRGSDMKIFQGDTVPEIIKKVLGKYPIDLNVSKLTETYRKWDYCVQYRESDFNFVSRLMEHEGIYYFFEHSAGNHKMVLCDSIAAHKPFPGYASVPYYPPDATYSDNEKDHFNSWLITQAVDPGTYVTNETDFKKPNADLKLIESQPKGHANASYEIYDFPGGYTELGDGEHYSKVRMEALQHQQESVVGTGHMRGAAPGYLLSLTNQKRSDQNRKYLVTACDYAMRDNQYEADGSGSYDFQAQMSAIPSSDPYRPKRLTPKPHTSGPESAVIVGPPGEEIYTDEFGRAKVQFPWDRIGKKNQDSTCWIRISNPWAGSNFGAISLPRIGQEVLVDFINGDPDRPIITHRLYNANNMPPWALPGNKTQSGILTRSSKGGDPGDGMKNGIGSANALRFEDMKGQEQLWLHAEKDQLTEVENDEDKWVGNDRRKTIDRDETNVIHRDRTETVDRNEKITVHGWRTEEVDLDETITIHKNRKERVDNNETISIGDNRKEDVGKNETISIGINRTETVGNNEKVKIGVNQNLTVGSNKQESIGLTSLKNVGIAQMTNIGAVFNLNVGAAWMSNVGMLHSHNVGMKFATTVGTSYTLSSGESVSVSSGSTIVHSAGSEISLVTGSSSITMKSDGTIMIKGVKVEIEGATIVDLDGKVIDMN